MVKVYGEAISLLRRLTAINKKFASFIEKPDGDDMVELLDEFYTKLTLVKQKNQAMVGLMSALDPCPRPKRRVVNLTQEA